MSKIKTKNTLNTLRIKDRDLAVQNIAMSLSAITS